MSNPKIKLCGLTRGEDVAAALSVGADFLGFIVECKSSRRLAVETAARLSLPAKGLAKTVSVTVNANIETLTSIVEKMQPDFIQFHGDETPEHLKSVKAKFNVGIIKAFSISTKADLETMADYFNIADYMLLDAKPPKDEEQRGGHGRRFDWSLLKNFQSPTPLIIAGGLTPETVERAVKMTNAHIFDVSSGIEVAAGIKDATLLAKFMKAAGHE